MWRKTAFLLSEPSLVRRVRAEIAWPDFSPALVVECTPNPKEYPQSVWCAFRDIKERDKEGTWQSQTEKTTRISPKIAWDIFNQNIYPWITKVRYRIPHGKQTIELDIFTKPALRGLVIAEVELRNPKEKVSLPSWIEEYEEVTEDARFQNVNLATLHSIDELELERIRE